MSIKKIPLFFISSTLVISALAGFFAASGQHQVNNSLQHSAYIWQRVWTPALLQSMVQMRGSFSELRVLAAELSVDEKLAIASVDFSALTNTGLPVYAVVRIDGRNHQQLNQATSTAIVKMVNRWQTQLPHLKGVELDYDCPRSQLGRYADFLRELRALLPSGLLLSNTALPDWTNSPELSPLLAQTDESVLQLHAVLHPAQGLFDPVEALAWIKAYKKFNPKHFQVALPAYGSRVAFNATGKIVAIESEQRGLQDYDHSLELEADPQTIARFLSELKRINQERVIWFRLPTTADRRAWSLGTLQAVIAGNPLAADLRVNIEPEVIDQKITGLVHLEILNEGNIASALPRQVQVNNAHCKTADGLNIYTALPVQTGWVFSTSQSEKILPQQRRQIAWLRCAPGIPKDDLNVIFTHE